MVSAVWRCRRLLALCAVVAVAAAAIGPLARGQDANEEIVPAAVDEASAPPSLLSSEKPPETILELIVAGGPMNIAFMIGLGLFSLVAAAVALERLVNLRRGRVLPGEFTRGLEELARRGERRPEEYDQLCQRNPSPAATILKAGLLRLGRPLTEVEKAMEDAAAREAASLRARVRPLSVISNVAPLIGLLGTVVGMLEAFRVASQAGLGKAELLAKGIYLALETTVAGLVIAIPALLCAAYFNARTERLLRETDERLMDVTPAFARFEQRGTAATASAPSSPGARPANPLR